MVEFAMVLPLLMMLFVGIAEFGFVFQQKLLVDNAVQTAARAGSTLGTNVGSDMAVLDALEQGFAGLPGKGEFLVTKVTIYLADSAGNVDSNLINTYSYAAGGGCSWTPCPEPANDTDESNIGGTWLPSTRSADVGVLDHMGVTIYYGHDWVLGGYGFLPDLPCNADGSQCWTESSVLRIEPVNL
jgi:Flp pilus assembly protein TadG